MNESMWTPKIRFALKLILGGLTAAVVGFFLNFFFSGAVGAVGHLISVLGIVVGVVGGVISLSTYADDS